MYEIQEDRIRRTAAETTARLAEERSRVEESIRASQREEHQVAACSREETRGFAAHESSSYQDHTELATKQNNDLLKRLNAANTKNMELDQQLQNYAQHMTMMQKSAAQQIYLCSSSKRFGCSTNSIACSPQ